MEEHPVLKKAIFKRTNARPRNSIEDRENTENSNIFERGPLYFEDDRSQINSKVH